MSSQSLKSNQKKEIPKDWRDDFFENYFDIFSGIGFKKSEYAKHGIKLLRIDNVSYEIITWESEAYLPIQYLKKFPKIVLEEGDILLALNRPITNGKLKIAILEKKDTPCILYQRVGKITILNPNDDKKFLFYVLQKYIKKFVEDTSVGTDQPFISTTKLKKLKLLLPTNSKEQFLIGRTLSDTNELIKQLDYLITKKKNIKQGTTQELLTGKRRLDGFNGKWILKKLGDVLKVKHGKSQKEIIDKNGQYPILATGGKIGMASKYLYDKPSALIGRKGTIDKPQYVDTPFWTIDTLFYTEMLNDTNPKFVFYKFMNIDWYSYNEASGVPSLNSKTIENIEQLFPPSTEEQKIIVKILTDMDSEIEQLEIKKEKYIMIKNGMMQKLLTGEIRLT